MGAAHFVLMFGLFAVSKAPWHQETHRVTPWGASGGSGVVASDAGERREGFFRSLVSRGEDPENFDGAELSSLPWNKYKSGWNSDLEGEFVWPVENGRINSGFGQRRGRLHEGLDIGGHEGQIIRSVASGRVVFSGSLRGYGNTVVVYHGQGISSVYAHNRENLAVVGQIVQRGGPVATVGRTGRATGHHVHFEIRKDGQAVNPLRYSFDRSWDVVSANR